MRSLRGAIFFAFLIMWTGYAIGGMHSNYKSKVIGRWQGEKISDIIEFYSDGRVDLGRGLIGNWTILDDGRIKIEASLFGFTSVSTAKFRGNTLHVTSRGIRGKRTANFRKISP